MKNKIIDFIINAIGFCFPFFIMFSYFAGCFELSEIFDKFNIYIPPFGFAIFNFISFGCCFASIKSEIEKKKEGKN